MLIEPGTIMVASYKTDRQIEGYNDGCMHYETDVYILSSVDEDQPDPFYEFDGIFTPYGENFFYVGEEVLRKMLNEGCMYWFGNKVEGSNAIFVTDGILYNESLAWRLRND